MTHGSQAAYSAQTGMSYDTYLATSLNNPTHTFISTIACITNAFDSSSGRKQDPCLSESFIRNSSNNVLGYFGSSRYGWDFCIRDSNGNKTGSRALGPSSVYDGLYYKTMFNGELTNRTYGSITTNAKIQRISSCGHYDGVRWLQFALNPIGDPEMHVFTESPTKLYANMEFKNGVCRLNTNETNYNLSITRPTHAELLDIYNVSNSLSGSVSFRFPKVCSICLTKAGKIPNVVKIVTLQDETISKDTDIDTDIILMGTSVNADTKPGDLYLESGRINIVSEKTFIGSNTIISNDVDLYIAF